MPLTGMGKSRFEGESGAQVWIFSLKHPLTAPTEHSSSLRKHIRQRLGVLWKFYEAFLLTEKFPFTLSGNAY